MNKVITQARVTTAAPSDHAAGRHIGINAVCDLCGGISHMTIWRWQNDAALTFPSPIYIGRRRYWKEADILAWLESRQEVRHATA